MNGFEKHKMTCISIIFAWTRGHYKLCNKHLMRRCIEFLKIDLRGKHHFEHLVKEARENLQIYLPNASFSHDMSGFELYYSHRGWKWAFSFCLQGKNVITRVLPCPTCMSPLTFKEYDSKYLCLHDHVVPTYPEPDDVNVLDLSRFRIPDNDDIPKFTQIYGHYLQRV
jgi:hypothetical protein